ncbi:hypothetical protein V2J95_25760, partial [Pseudomonas alliivorans]|nr:hypothetical protein [Pseudomonas alliivorans]
MSAYAGIDVSKATLQVALFPKADELCVPNTEEGLARIAEYLNARQVERVLIVSAPRTPHSKQLTEARCCAPDFFLE